jgi:hypothetical protein
MILFRFLPVPISSWEEPTSKPLIQYKHKGRKPKSVVGQGEHKVVGFRWGFLKSSSSSLPLADYGVSGGGCATRAHSLNSAGGLQPISPLEWSVFCSSMGFETKGQEDKSVGFLSTLMRSIGGWIRLRVVSIRGLGVGLFCGLYLGRVGGEAVASCILRLY